MLTGIDAAMDVLRAAQAEFVVKFAVSVSRVVRQVHEGVLSRHPVWSGESIAAWHWGIDSSGAAAAGAAGSARQKYSSSDRERFGRTGKLALGAEPMRATATAVVDAELAAMRIDPKDPFHKYILANDHPRTEQLEYGALPRTSRSRSPGGMVRITESELSAMIGTLI